MPTPSHAVERERAANRSPDPDLLDELRDLTQEEFDEFAKLKGWPQDEQDRVAFWIAEGWRYFERPVPVETFLFSRAYMNANDERGRPVLWPEAVKAIKDICEHDYVEAVLTGGIGVAKALALDTQIPTPAGWSRMGDLRDGDLVFDERGEPCRVMRAHPVLLGERCYRVGFSDGTSIVASADHLWRTWDKYQRQNKTAPKVRTTEELAASLDKRHAIEVAGPLSCVDVPRLGADPYTLGAWLGDGSSSSAQLWCQDQEILDEVRRYYHLTRRQYADQVPSHCVHGLTKSLRELGVLGRKHVPPNLLRASFEQRLALLQGLMDTDGTVGKQQGRCCFSSCNERLVKDVLELVRTLGMKPTLLSGPAKIRGRTVGVHYRVGFTPPPDLPVFRLPRKLKYQSWRARKRYNARWRVVETIDLVESVPVRCITVDSPSSLYLAGESMVPTHNTTIALYVQAYEIYRLLCQKNPHGVYGLDPTSEIVFAFQSCKLETAADVDYARLRKMVERAPIFSDVNFKFDGDKKSRLVFGKNVRAEPFTGARIATVGQNVIAGILDEIADMALIKKSARRRDQAAYDQAVELYSSIAMRRESRFMEMGEMPGKLCLVGSRKYPDDFLHKKLEEARDRPDKIYVYDKRIWDVKPWAYGDRRFWVFVGDATRKPRILEDDEKVVQDDQDLVVQVPVELRPGFERDLLDALRDVCGLATMAIHPFIMNRDLLAVCFGKVKSCATRPDCDFDRTRVAIKPSRWKGTEGFPRFAHLDLARSQDSAGLAIGHVRGFKSMRRSAMVDELLPIVRYDLVLEVRPPRGGEINFEKIRRLLYLLREHGMPLKWVTCDEYQCVSGESRVWTDRGLVPAREVQVGDVVQSKTGARKVEKAWAFGRRPVLRVTTTDGHDLAMTSRHRIEVEGEAGWEWRLAGDLKVGDVVRVWDKVSDLDPGPVPLLPARHYYAANQYEMPATMTPALALWLGLVWGDGNVDRDGVHVTCHDGEVGYVTSAFHEAGLPASVSDLPDRKASRVSVSSRGLVRWLQDNGLEKGPEIPEVVWRSPVSVQAAFLRGLMSADGNVGVFGRCTLSTRHRGWARWAQDFLRSAFGIASRITTVEGGSQFKPGRIQYVLGVRGSRAAFADAVGFVGPKADQLLRYRHVPGRRIKTRVAAVEAGEAEVFDFQVEGDPSYVVNGLVSHNSTDMLQILGGQGFVVGKESTDRTTDPYELLKTALYDGRVEAPEHPKALMELARLERDPQTGKVDHPGDGCFTGETRVALLDGTCPTFTELANRKEPFWVYAMTEQGMVAAEASNARVTKHVDEVVHVLLDNYHVVRCTSDHRWMLLDGTWVQARDLEPSMSLMPLYRYAEWKGGNAGYERVWCPVREERMLTHHLVAGKPNPGSIVHHVDGNKRNNHPHNLEHLTRSEHLSLHGREFWDSRRESMRAGHRRYVESGGREVSRQVMRRNHSEGRMRPRRSGSQKNHRVLSVQVEHLEFPEPVYDLTVPGPENFALASGVFVHNSKDLADAMACVAFGLTMMVETWMQHGIDLARIPETIQEYAERQGKDDVEGRM